MKTNIIRPIIASVATLCLALSSTSVFADQCSPNVCGGNYPDSVKAGCGCSTGTSTGLPTAVVNIIYSVIGIAGLIAIVFVVVGGVQYMTSSGDPGKVKKAKDTILYSIIGLIVCTLAFAIVNFVITQIIK